MLQILSNTYDECGEPGWVSLNELLVRLSSSHFAENDDDDYGKGAGDFISSAVDVLERCEKAGYIEKYENASIERTPIRISADGFKAVEQFDLPAEIEISPVSVLSKSWTGLTLSQDQIDEAIDEIDRISRRVEELKLDNQKKQQALALLGGARALMNAPEPPLDIVRLILQNFDRCVGIAGLLIGWVGLVQSWIH